MFSWLICESYDDKGNAIVYTYEKENSHGYDLSQANERNRTASTRSSNRYLKRINYGNRVSRLIEPDLTAAEWLFTVLFDYDEDYYENVALDPGSAGGPGGIVLYLRLLHRVNAGRSAQIRFLSTGRGLKSERIAGVIAC